MDIMNRDASSHKRLAELEPQMAEMNRSYSELHRQHKKLLKAYEELKKTARSGTEVRPRPLYALHALRPDD
jgi:hypothetical protein